MRSSDATSGAHRWPALGRANRGLASAWQRSRAVSLRRLAKQTTREPERALRSPRRQNQLPSYYHNYREPTGELEREPKAASRRLRVGMQSIKILCCCWRCLVASLVGFVPIAITIRMPSSRRSNCCCIIMSFVRAPKCGQNWSESECCEQEAARLSRRLRSEPIGRLEAECRMQRMQRMRRIRRTRRMINRIGALTQRTRSHEPAEAFNRFRNRRNMRPRALAGVRVPTSISVSISIFAASCCGLCEALIGAEPDFN